MLSSSYRCLLSLQRSLPSFSVFKAVSRSFSSKPIQAGKIDPEADNLIQETSTESYTEPIPLDVAAKQVSALKTDSTAPGTAESGNKETSGAGIPPVTQDTITAWFDFMDIREKPYGNWKTYEPDQIFSSLEFDLYGKNCEEIYKYEKDDLFVNFVCSPSLCLSIGHPETSQDATDGRGAQGQERGRPEILE